MTERLLRWPRLPLIKSARQPARRFIMPVRSLWPLTERDAHQMLEKDSVRKPGSQEPQENAQNAKGRPKILPP